MTGPSELSLMNSWKNAQLDSFDLSLCLCPAERKGSPFDELFGRTRWSGRSNGDAAGSSRCVCWGLPNV